MRRRAGLGKAVSAGRARHGSEAEFDREVARCRRHRADGDLGNEPRGRVADRRADSGPATADTAERRERISKALDYMGLDARHGAGGYSHRPRVYRLLHQRADRGLARRRRGGERPQRASWRRGLGRPGLRTRQGAGRGRRARQVFLQAGFQWREAGCSLCLGTNGETVAPGQRCASTSNRNFVGRQGRGARTHLISPPMAAAAAVTGHLTDVRQMRGELTWSRSKNFARHVPCRHEYRHRPDTSGALPVEAAGRRICAVSVSRSSLRGSGSEDKDLSSTIRASKRAFWSGTTISDAARRARMRSGRSATMVSV